ncbi:MAG: helix-turn-helix domain-containing protein [Holophagales bacterium]|nr:helix-turn-helix domain-containing protein [Holophagales bacterium]
MRVVLLAIEGMFDTGLSVLLDTLATANDLSAGREQRSPFRVQVAGVRERVVTQQGFRVPTVPVDAVAAPDLVLVPALGEKSPETLGEALDRDDVRDAAAQLSAWHEGGARVAAACTGTYLLASTGLLDGRRATTTWWLAPDFRQRFDSVELDDTQMVVDSEGRVTAGAALAHVDLALWFVREHSPTLARITSRHLLVDGRPSQATYAMSDHLAHADPIVERFERWARHHLRDFTMAAAARAVGASERTLERRLRKVLGQTPISFVRRLRVERALLLLETTNDSVESIAGEVGYGDGVTLRTLLREKTGLGIRQLRRQL